MDGLALVLLKDGSVVKSDIVRIVRSNNVSNMHYLSMPMALRTMEIRGSVVFNGVGCALKRKWQTPYSSPDLVFLLPQKQVYVHL